MSLGKARCLQGRPDPGVSRSPRTAGGQSSKAEERKKELCPAQGPRSILRQRVHFQVLCFHSNPGPHPPSPTASGFKMGK